MEGKSWEILVEQVLGRLGEPFLDLWRSWARISLRIVARIRPRWVQLSPSCNGSDQSWNMLALRWRPGAQLDAFGSVWGRFWDDLAVVSIHGQDSESDEKP